MNIYKLYAITVLVHISEFIGLHAGNDVPWVYNVDCLFHAVVQVGFDPTVYAVDEDAGLVNLTIVKLTTANIPVSVLLSTVGGSAIGECF